MPLIRDLISIPDQVHKGDYVLRLTEGVQDPVRTVDDYVVTPDLVSKFEDALKFIKSACDASLGGKATSKAAYLHGSFGAGKSHFMAVLSLLLAGNPAVRAKPALGQLADAHSWVAGKKFMLVPFHMIAATSMESAILGGYAHYVAKHHPTATQPAVFLADAIFKDAIRLRASIGDDAFFKMLNAGSGGKEDGWGDLSSTWNASSFDRAVQNGTQDADRLRLVGDVVDRLFTVARSNTHGRDNAFVSLDDGLAIISRHAKSLGYDALILFLDELVLWLMSHAADIHFVQTEGQKLVKLVESQTADRSIPIISFIARQRDLREVIGTHVAGADKLNFADTLKHWEGRFHTITLGDSNLPAIVQERILRLKDPVAGKALIDDEFEKTKAIRKEIMDLVLTREGDRDQFRKLYPFSPALVQVLVAVSGALQRERTAIKVLMQLLVNQSDVLELGQIVPVGDLWDVIAEGEEVFAEAMKINLTNAMRLYRERLRPMLLEEAGIAIDWNGKTPLADPKAANGIKRFKANDRLIKTVLLAALVPQVEALRDLNARKLLALNHGTIKTPFAGQEMQELVSRVNFWAGSIPELRVAGDRANPTVSIALSGVDTNRILLQVDSEDNESNRKRKLKELLFEELGISAEETVTNSNPLAIEWRGSKRSVEVLYLNVRDANDENFRADHSDWKLLVDYPFDKPGFTAADDRAKCTTFTDRNPDGTQTLVWLPRFFSDQALTDLGTLIRIDRVLSGKLFDGYAADYSPSERPQLKANLESQQDALRKRMISCLRQAYGLDSATTGMVEDDERTLAEHFVSLRKGFTVRLPASATLKDAATNLIHQALEHQYPGHPEFGIEIKPAVVKRIYDYVSSAQASPEKRCLVEQPHRPEMRAIAVPLKLGEMGDQHFAVKNRWIEMFERFRIQGGIDSPTVRKLKEWIDRDNPTGLDPRIRHLIIGLYAQATNRSFYVLGGPVSTTGAVIPLDSISDDMDLREQVLPEEAVWISARSRAMHVFGLNSPELRTSATVVKLVQDIRAQISARQTSAADLVAALREAMIAVRVQPGSSQRNAAATAAQTLVNNLINRKDDNGLISELAQAKLDGIAAPIVGQSLAQAGEQARLLQGFDWTQAAMVGDLDGEFGVQGQALIRKLQSLLIAQDSDAKLADVLPAIKVDIRQIINSALAARNAVADEASKKRREQVEQERLRKDAEDVKARAIREAEESARRLRDDEAMAARKAELDRRQTEMEEQRRREDADRVARAAQTKIDVVSSADVGVVLQRVKELAEQNPKAKIEVTYRIILDS